MNSQWESQIFLSNLIPNVRLSSRENTSSNVVTNAIVKYYKLLNRLGSILPLCIQSIFCFPWETGQESVRQPQTTN